MGKDEILNEIIDIKKRIGSIDAKIDRVIKKQVELEKKFASFEKIQKTLNAIPAKLNTTTYQITSQLESEIKDIEDEFDERIEDTMSNMEELVNINKRLDVFEENLKAYISKMRLMLIEMEDSIRGILK